MPCCVSVRCTCYKRVCCAIRCCHWLLSVSSLSSEAIVFLQWYVLWTSESCWELAYPTTPTWIICVVSKSSEITVTINATEIAPHHIDNISPVVVKSHKIVSGLIAVQSKTLQEVVVRLTLWQLIWVNLPNLLLSLNPIRVFQVRPISNCNG